MVDIVSNFACSIYRGYQVCGSDIQCISETLYSEYEFWDSKYMNIYTTITVSITFIEWLEIGHGIYRLWYQPSYISGKAYLD